MSDGFFAVDRRAWNRARDFGVNAAITYLVLARGSGGDNRTTAWSTQAVEKRANISRPRAKKAIATLVEKKLLTVLRGGTLPRYHIQIPEDVPGSTVGLTAGQEAAVTALTKKRPRPKRSPWSTARLQEEGKITIDPETGEVHRQYSDPDWIWLPNTVVDGAAGEVSPIGLLRQTQNIDAIRLFVNLYHAHHLATNGGIEWRQDHGLRETFKREKLYENGEWVIWAFPERYIKVSRELSALRDHLLTLSDEDIENDNWETFWAAKTALTDIGLLEVVTHLVDGTTSDSEIIHPFPIYEAGETWEHELTRAASQLCARLLPPELCKEKGKYWAVIPTMRHFANANLVGIFRMKYRPHTAATAAWLALSRHHGLWEAYYDTQYQSEIKVASK